MALELASCIVTLQMVLLAEGFQRPSFYDLPLTLALLSFGGGWFLRDSYSGGSEMHHSQIAGWLVGVAAALTIICAIGLAMVKNTFERLHFSAAVTSLGAGLIALAVWVADPAWQSKIKATLIAIVLFLMN